MIDVDDTSGIEQLQEIFDRISSSINDMAQTPTELITKLKNASRDSINFLQTAVKGEVKSAEENLEKVSNQVCLLQELVDSALNGNVPEEISQPQVCDSSNEGNDESKALISEEDAALLQDFISEAAEHIESAEAGLLELENQPDDEENLNLIFRSFDTIKGMAGFLDLAEIGSLAHTSENLLDLARKGQVLLIDENVDVIFEAIDALKQMVENLRASVKSGCTATPQQGLEALLTRLEACTLEKADTKQEIDNNVPAGSTNQKAAKSQPKMETSNNLRSIKASSDSEKVKISTKRLDDLVNMVGELVIAQSMVAQDVNDLSASSEGFNRKVTHQGKIIRDMQELAMSMRMVPLAGVFQKMTRLVRDLSQKAGKQVRFNTKGEETELDRNIIDKVADPLVHMIRNAVDHGIESAEQRLNAGKEPAGQICLQAFHQAGSIVIEIQDDGKGLDKDRILKKAVDKGVIEPGQVLPDEKVFELIFHPGLSTAQKITDVSGRGVGMDVVRKNIEALRGRVDITSIAGKGTTFSIRLPLTLAIIDGQIVSVGKQRYIIPINSIIHSLRPTSEQIHSVHGKGEVVMMRKELLPLVRLHRLFDITASTTDPSESLLVIVEEDGKKCCLLVDELLGQQQIVIKTLGNGLGKIKGVSGCSIMGDGKINLILDVPGLVDLAQS
jgi:two-component system chemotaxis sensor kinase CheA